MLSFRGAFIPYLIEIAAATYKHLLEVVMCELLSEAMIFLALGFATLSAFSLWFDVKTIKTKLAMIAGIAALLPTIIIIAEHVAYYLISNDITMFLLFNTIQFMWTRILALWCLPFISGVLLFLGTNRKLA